MTVANLELDTDEARHLRALLIPEWPDERRLLVLVREGRAIQAVRTDLGPIPELPRDLHTGGVRRARTHPGLSDVDRLVAVELGSSGAPPSFLTGLVEGKILADPPFVPALESVRRLPARVRRWAARLLPDGRYVVALEDAGILMSIRLWGGRVREIRGGRSFGIDGHALDARGLAAALREHGAEARFVLVATESRVRSILESRRPVTALDRASIRGAVAIPASSLRVRVAFLALRLLGL